jgi:hypothetical protein
VALYAIALWVGLLACLLYRDPDAFVLSLVLTPVFGALSWFSLRVRHTVLSMFMGLAFVSHAIAPPFFFMRREFYTYGGDFGAVKDFAFGVVEFLHIYLYVVIFLVAVVSFATILPPRGHWSTRTQTRYRVRELLSTSRFRYSSIALGFVLLLALPLNLVMYRLRIGMTGIEPRVLPYRLTGLLTYSRMFFVPVTVFALYSTVRRRTLVITTAVLGYAALAGFASLSRFIVLAGIAPVLVFALVDRSVPRFIVAMTAGSLLFVLVSASRDYAFTRELPLPSLVATTVRNYPYADFSPLELVGGVANRLWGPQDVVLASQYHVPSRSQAIFRYFTSQVVVEDLTYEFYGMKFTDQTAGYGVGLGFIPWMIMLADRDIFVLGFLALVTACLLNSSEWMVRRVAERENALRTVTAQILAFGFVYCIYISAVHWWLDLAVVTTAVLGARWALRSRTAGRHSLHAS